MGILENKARRIILKYAVDNLQKLDVKSGTCRLNYKCHMNSVNDAIINGEDRVAMCFYVDDDWPIIHFVNIDSNNEITDNTLGVWSTQHDYYLIRIIDKCEVFNVNRILSDQRRYLKKLLPFYIRWFSDCDF